MYRARDAKLARDIALKILPAELSSNAEALRRFEQEARSASALNHPNIVTIYDIGHSDDVAWIAMELIDGTDLRTMLAREPMSLKNALRIAVKVADGLAAAHERGIVHRDLKPDNVMITPEGFVKLLDFGLAKQFRILSSDETTIPQTSPGAVFGTVGYMSPEQAMGKEMDACSDQFSFGVMLYEMLTRARPFERASKAETMAAIIRDAVPPPSSVNEALGHDLDRIIARCLAKDSRQRYASTRDLAHDLREVRDGMTHGSGRAPVSHKTPAPWKAPGQVRGLRSVIAAIVVLAILAGAYVMWKRRDRALHDVTSIAVLPFRDLSATPDGRIFANGISEIIAARLAELRGVRVASPFDGAGVSGDDVRTMAKRTGAQVIVRGTVQRERGEVRVSYALLGARDGGTLASKTVTRPETELFALEDAVVSDLIETLGRPAPQHARAVATTLGPDDQRRFIEAVGLLQGMRKEESVDRAIATLESLLRNARDSGAVNALLARALLYKSTLARRPELLEQAMIYATRGVTLSANDPEVHLTMGRLLNASGQYADAVKSIERALALRPDQHGAIVALGNAYQGLGRDADAESMYRKAIALRPDAVGARMEFGAFCYGRGHYEEAVTQFRTASDLVPELSLPHANLGAALQAIGRDDEALAAFKRSIAIKPTTAGWSNLGSLQFYLGRFDEARKSYEQAVALSPTDPAMWVNLGDACRMTSAPERATDAYARAIKAAREVLAIKPNDAYQHSLVALSLARNGDGEEAQNAIRRALEINPTNASVLYKAAVIAMLRGNPESAMSWLQRAIAAGYPVPDAERDPDFAAIRQSPSFRNAVKSSS